MNKTLARFNQEVMTRDTAWTAASILAVIAGATLARTVLKGGWRAATGNEPPADPDADDTSWKQALAWGISTGALIGIIRALARKGSSAAERRWS